jgi:D-inositol-3-phosphate glycosyltransferase
VIDWASTRTLAINDDVAASFHLGSIVVLNSVDLDRFHPGDAAAARTNLGLSAEGPVVSAFGFLYPAKGFHVLLEAAATLRERGVRATYLLVGGGVRDQMFFARRRGRALRLLGLVRDHERHARRLASTLELGDDVRFIPYVDDTAEFYRASDVVVAPSQGPELGRSVIEAAASGVPVVTSGSTTGGGVVIPEETGLIAGTSSAEAIAAAIETLLRNPPLRRIVGSSARQHAEAHFDCARNTRIVERVYLDLLHQDASGVLGRRAVAATCVTRAS